MYIHDEHGELDLGADDVGPGAQLHQQVRAWLHRHRRAHETLRLHDLLRKVLLQQRHRNSQRARDQGTRILPRPYAPDTPHRHALPFLSYFIE
jgi:hypothetical protein